MSLDQSPPTLTPSTAQKMTPTLTTLTELVQEGHLAVKDAAEKVGMTVEEFQKQMEKIKK